MLRGLIAYVKGVVRRGRIDTEVDEELQFHLEMEIQANFASGMNPEEARRVAMRDLGGVTQTRESIRAVRTLWLDRALREVRQAVRALGRSPGHSTVAVISLAIGLAVCIAAFSAIRALAFGDVPGIRNRHTLAVVSLNYERTSGTGLSITSSSRLSTSDFELFAQTHGPALDAVAAESPWIFPLDDGRGRRWTARGFFVTGTYFQVLGTQPINGRLLLPKDDAPGSDPVVVIGEGYWRQVLGGRDVVGATIVVAGRNFTIVGIAPRRFPGVIIGTPGPASFEWPQLWVPLHHAATFARTPRKDEPWHTVFGRLAAHHRLSEARQSMGHAAAAIESALPSIRRHASVSLRPHGNDLSEDAVDGLGAVALFMLLPISVLCVACANVANLQLARSTESTHEIRVRLALGASRLQVMRPLLYEVAIIAAASTFLGWYVAKTVLYVCDNLSPLPMPLDTAVLAFSVVLVVAVTVLSGCVPAWVVMRRCAHASLKQTAAAGSAGHARLRSVLVGAQVAISIVLIFVTTLSVRSLRTISDTASASAKDVGIARLNLSDLDVPAVRNVLDTAVQRVSSDRRVKSAAVGVVQSTSEVRYWLPGDDGEVRRVATVGVVTPSWFNTVGARLVAGRLFRESDGESTIAVLSSEFAEIISMNSAAALGKYLKIQRSPNEAAQAVEVVGVTTNPLPSSLWPAAPALYVPMGTMVPDGAALFFRAQPVAPVFRDLRGMLADVRPGLTWTNLTTLAAGGEAQGVPLRYIVLVFGGLGALALILATTGLYAVVSYVVSLRTREIGIRMALGACRRDVVRMVMGHSIRLTLYGALSGLVLAAPLAFAMRALIIGVQPSDPLAVSQTVGLFLITAVAAAAFPAHRAASVDPTISIREE